MRWFGSPSASHRGLNRTSTSTVGARSSRRPPTRLVVAAPPGVRTLIAVLIVVALLPSLTLAAMLWFGAVSSSWFERPRAVPNKGPWPAVQANAAMPALDGNPSPPVTETASARRARCSRSSGRARTALPDRAPSRDSDAGAKRHRHRRLAGRRHAVGGASLRRRRVEFAAGRDRRSSSCRRRCRRWRVDTSD